MDPTSLLTDRYELTMVDAARRAGTAERPAVFETFARRLPAGRRFGVVAGLGRLVDAIESFRFEDRELAALDAAGVVSPDTLSWLAGYRFRGDVHAYREGEPYFPGSPVLTVTAPFADGVILETLVLSVLNYDSAVASAAARMVAAASGRGLFEFGSRRAHEQAAVAAARAAYLVGFDGSSNLEAGARHGIPTFGTSAHSYTLLHDDERSAFEAQVDALGPGTTLLVDTYDTTAGIATALDVAGPGLGAIRIDSGDLGDEARRARAQLDDAGATSTRIVVSGDLDEFKLADLVDAPIDAYGVGTSVVTGSGAPTANFIYKLVARAATPDGPMVPVGKTAGAKSTLGGRKQARRRLHGDVAVAEVLRPWDEPLPQGERALQVPVLRAGERVAELDLERARAHHAAALAELPEHALAVSPGDPCVPTDVAEFTPVPVHAVEEAPS